MIKVTTTTAQCEHSPIRECPLYTTAGYVREDVFYSFFYLFVPVLSTVLLLVSYILTCSVRAPAVIYITMQRAAPLLNKHNFLQVYSYLTVILNN